MRMQIHRSNRWAVVCMHCRIYACVHTAVDLVGTRYELAIVRHTIHTAAVQLCVTPRRACGRGVDASTANERRTMMC
jgi:hypothetical protein